jgi:hypothetical protein
VIAGAIPRQPLSVSPLEIADHWLYRIIAAYCLLFGILYWVRLIGYYPGNLWRFDLMPAYWQVTVVALAVLYPLAASGLWMLASWGPVIWLICAATETVMFAGFPELFGHRMVIVALHAVTALLFVAFSGALYFEQRRRRRELE